MATQEQERRSPPLEPARTASDQPQLPGLGPILTGRSAATTTMEAADIAGGGGGGEEEWGTDGRPDTANVRSSSPWVALLSAVSSHIASPHFKRKPRRHVPRVARSHPWGSKIPVFPPAPAKKKRNRPKKKRDRPCPLCSATVTPLWRTWPTDRRVMLCNACGIRVRAPGTALPELVYLGPHPATTTVVSELQQPVPPPPQEIQHLYTPWAAVLPEQVHVHLPPPAMAMTTVVSELQQPVPLPEQVPVQLPPPATATTTVVSELEQPVPPPQEIQQPVSEDSPRAVLPAEQVHVHLPPPATATTTVVSELEQPRQKEIQDSESPPDSPILESMVHLDVYLLKRTSPRRRDNSPPPPPPPTAEPAPPTAPPAPGNDKSMKKCCTHCAITKTPQWRTGPAGEGTLCNSCGVRYRKGLLFPEYRPWASPTFNGAEHSNTHREVLKIRKSKDHPTPPAPFKLLKTRKRRNGINKGQQQQQQPAPQIRKERKAGNEEQKNQPPAGPAAIVAMLQVVRNKNKGKTQQRLPPEPALLKHRRELSLKGKEPRAGDGMGHHHLPPPPPPPPALLLPHAGKDHMVLQQRLPASPPLPLPHATGHDMEMEQHLLPLPPAQEAHAAGDELMMMSEPIPQPGYGRENLFLKGKAPAQVRKKRKGNKEQNQAAAHVQPATMAVLEVRKKSKGKEQRLPPEPALLKRRKEPKGKEQLRRPPQPAAATQPRAGNDMLQNLLPPPPPAPPALPRVRCDMARYVPFRLRASDGLLFLPPVLRRAGREMEQHLLPPPPPEPLPHTAGNMETGQQQLPPPLPLPHAGGELMMDEPIPPPDPFLFDGPAPPRLIDDDEPVVIVIDDD